MNLSSSLLRKILFPVTKLAPTSSDVHVPTAGEPEDDEKEKEPVAPADIPDSKLQPTVNNLEAEMIKTALQPDTAIPDPATADDAEPRTGVYPFESMPDDQMLAADALGYTWSDQTTSGFGNRLHGYPSQGALGTTAEKEHDKANMGVLRSAFAAFAGALSKFFSEEEDEDGGIEKDALTTEGRKRISDSNFAIPGERAYPIHDISHARNALARSSGKPEEERVRTAVYRKYPGLRPDKASKCDFGERRVPIIKRDLAKQIAYCVVLEPDMVDSQEDVMSADDIEKTAHAYLVKSRVIGASHEKPIDAVPVESYIAPQDLSFDNAVYGPQVVKKGSWVLGIKVEDPDEWQKVVNGEYTGVSVAGYGNRV